MMKRLMRGYFVYIDVGRSVCDAIRSVVAVTPIPRNLRQYYADLLMLELLTAGRL